MNEDMTVKQTNLFDTHKEQNWTGVKDNDLSGFADQWVIVRDNKAYHTVHRLHPYFAMCPPPIARKAIERYSKQGDLTLDPFCGAGVTNVEALISGRNSIGIDILPIAVLLAKVKTTPVVFDFSEVAAMIQRIGRVHSRLSEKDIRLPPVYNVDYWFSSETQRQLSAIREIVLEESDSDRKDFLKICLSSIIRKVSRSGDMEAHLHIKEGKRVTNAIKFFEARLFDMITRMNEFRQLIPGDVKTVIIEMDNRAMSEIIKENSIDYIFTSPPYGTGTKYASVYRLQSEILELKRPIRPHDQAKDFALELGKTFRIMFTVLKRGGFCSILYGTNNSFSSADVLRIAEEQGFTYKETILCPIIDESKMIRGDYRRSMPNEHLITLVKQ